MQRYAVGQNTLGIGYTLDRACPYCSNIGVAIDAVFPIINCQDLARSEAFYRLVFDGV